MIEFTLAVDPDDAEVNRQARLELAAALCLVISGDQICPACLEPIEDHMMEAFDYHTPIFNHVTVGGGSRWDNTTDTEPPQNETHVLPVCPNMSYGM